MDKGGERLLPGRRWGNCALYFTTKDKDGAGEQKPAYATGAGRFGRKQIQLYTGWKKGADIYQYQKSMEAAYAWRLLGVQLSRWQPEKTGLFEACCFSDVCQIFSRWFKGCLCKRL